VDISSCSSLFIVGYYKLEFRLLYLVVEAYPAFTGSRMLIDQSLIFSNIHARRCQPRCSN